MRHWDVRPSDAPVLATAIHAGHAVRPELEAALQVDRASRLREEDPGTELFAEGLRGLSPAGSWAWSDPAGAPARLPRQAERAEAARTEAARTEAERAEAARLPRETERAERGRAERRWKPRPPAEGAPWGAPWQPTTVSVRRSRFEVELNRSRDQAMYRGPEQAWGLDVWRRGLDPEQLRISQAIHDAFYGDVERLIRRASARTGRFVLLDLHSYCHRRGGPAAAPDSPEANPEINVGTASIDNARWRPLIDRFMADLRGFDFGGRRLDVRENVKFGGGHFPRWVNHRFGREGCAIAVEIKKTYVDEWTGAVAPDKLRLLQRALRATLPGLVQELQRG